MININKHGIIISKTELGFENDGVLNPAVIQNKDGIHMFYRAVRKGNFSSIGYCLLDTPLTIKSRSETPAIFSQYDYECKGTEDPRLVKIENLYYLTYTAYNGINALGAMAISEDLENFDKYGIVVPQITYEEFSRLAETKGIINSKYLRYNERRTIDDKDLKNVFVWDKNVILFPRKIDGKFYMLHRIRPDIQIVAFHNFEELTTDFWQRYFFHLEACIVLSPKYKHEISYIGGGCPPIECEAGWLLIYHAVHDTVQGYVYSACAALLELDNPQKEICRLPYPLFKPELEWELKGEVNNVCFPTGTVLENDNLYIYYGAADSKIACASVSFSSLIQELLKHASPNIPNHV